MIKSWTAGFQAAAVASLQSNAPTQAFRVGAALYAGSRLLSIGFNQYTKTHTMCAQHPRNQKHFETTIHAEVSALIKRQHYDNHGNLILYVYRELATGKPGVSKPCKMCQEIIKLSGIKRVRYYNTKGQPEEWKVNRNINN